MSGKIIVLLGKTLSGKSTIANILEETYKFNRVLSFTTRPKRQNEIDLVDYIFIEDYQVYLMIGKGDALALRAYQPHPSFGPYPWYYGLNKKDIIPDENPVIITDFKGLKDVEEKFGKDKIISFYLDVDRKNQEKRLKSRGKELTQEQIRRMNADDVDFKNVESYVDFVIDGSKQPKTIAKTIKKHIDEAIN